MDGARILFEYQVFHALVSVFLPRLAEQDHQNDPLDLFNIDIRRVQRQQPVDQDFALWWRQDADLLEVGYIATARHIEPILFQVVVNTCAVRRLRVTGEVLLVVSEPLEPVKSTVDFRITEARAGEFAAQFVVIGFGVFVGVDVRFKEIHQYVEYVFFHAWSGSLVAWRLTKYLLQ